MTHPPGLHKSHSDGRVVPAPFRSAWREGRRGRGGVCLLIFYMHAHTHTRTHTHMRACTVPPLVFHELAGQDLFLL